MSAVKRVIFMLGKIWSRSKPVKERGLPRLRTCSRIEQISLTAGLVSAIRFVNLEDP